MRKNRVFYIFLLSFVILRSFTVFSGEYTKVWRFESADMYWGNLVRYDAANGRLEVKPVPHALEPNTEVLFHFEDLGNASIVDESGRVRLRYDTVSSGCASTTGIWGTALMYGTCSMPFYHYIPGAEIEAIGFPYPEFTVDAWVSGRAQEGGTVAEIVSSFLLYTWSDMDSTRVTFRVGMDSLVARQRFHVDEWHHVAGVASESGDYLALYIDGVLDTANNAWYNTVPNSEGNDLTMCSGSMANGVRVDDFRICSEAKDETNLFTYPTADSMTYVYISKFNGNYFPCTRLQNFTVYSGDSANGNIRFQLTRAMEGLQYSWHNGATWEPADDLTECNNSTDLTHPQMEAFTDRGGDSLGWRIFLNSPDGHSPVAIDSVVMTAQIMPVTKSVYISEDYMQMTWYKAARISQTYRVRADTTYPFGNSPLLDTSGLSHSFAMEDSMYLYFDSTFVSHVPRGKNIYWGVAVQIPGDTAWNVSPVDSFIYDPLIQRVSYLRSERILDVWLIGDFATVDLTKWGGYLFNYENGDTVRFTSSNLEIDTVIGNMIKVRLVGFSDADSAMLAGISEMNGSGRLGLALGAIMNSAGSPRQADSKYITIMELPTMDRFAVVPGDGAAHLRWYYPEDNFSSISQYYIYRDRGDAVNTYGMPYDSVSAGVFSYDDLNVSNGQIFTYSIAVCTTSYSMQIPLTGTMSIPVTVTVSKDETPPELIDYHFSRFRVRTGDTVYASCRVDEFLSGVPEVTCAGKTFTYTSGPGGLFNGFFEYYIVADNVSDGVYPVQTMFEDLSGNQTIFNAGLPDIIVDNTIKAAAVTVSPRFANRNVNVNVTLEIDDVLAGEPDVQIGGIAMNYESVQGNIYNYTIKIDNRFNEGTLNLSVSYIDSLGNDTNYIAGTLVTDFTAPFVNLNPPDDDGAYAIPFDLIMNPDEPCSIFYTLDGNDPARDGTGSLLYTGAIHVSGDTEVRYMAVDSARNWSEIWTAHYTKEAGSGITVNASSWSNGANVCVGGDMDQYEFISVYRVNSTTELVGAGYPYDRGCFWDPDQPTGALNIYTAVGRTTAGTYDTAAVCSVVISSQPHQADTRPEVEVGPGKQYSSIQAAVMDYDNAFIRIFPGQYAPVIIEGEKNLTLEGIMEGGFLPSISGNQVLLQIKNIQGNSDFDGHIHINNLVLENAQNGLFIENARVEVSNVLLKNVVDGILISESASASGSDSDTTSTGGGSQDPDYWCDIRSCTFIGSGGGTAIKFQNQDSRGLVINSMIVNFGFGINGGPSVISAFNNFWQVDSRISGSVEEKNGILEKEPEFAEQVYFQLDSNSVLATASSAQGPIGAVYGISSGGSSSHFDLPEPENLKVSIIGDFAQKLVRVTWDAPPDVSIGMNANHYGYLIFRSTEDSIRFGELQNNGDGPPASTDYMKVTVVTTLTESILDTLPAIDELYYYWIVALFRIGSDSVNTAGSDFVGPFVFGDQNFYSNRPKSVENFQAYDTPDDRGGSITLSWDKPADGKAHYLLISYTDDASLVGDTSVDPTDHILPDTLDASTTAYTFTEKIGGTPITDGTPYYFAVLVFDSVGRMNDIDTATDVDSAAARDNSPETQCASRIYYGAVEFSFSGSENGAADNGGLEYYYSFSKSGTDLDYNRSAVAKGTKVYKRLEDGDYKFQIYAVNPENNLSDLSPSVCLVTVRNATNKIFGSGNSWQLISVPSKGISTQNFTGGRELFVWDETIQVPDKLYDKYLTTQEISRIDSAKGYWYRNTDSVTLTVSKTSLLAEDQSVKMSLTAGWNMVGNPHCYAVDMSGSVLKFFPFDAEKQMYGDPVKVLEPWKGYWVEASGNTTITFETDPWFEPAGTTTRLAKTLFRNEKNWKLQLSVASGGKSDENNYFGLNPAANSGKDGYDLSEPPLFGDCISLYFLRDGASSKMLSADFREYSDHSNFWTFGIDGGESGTATLEVKGINDLPDNLNVYIGTFHRDGSFRFGKVDKSTGMYALALRENVYHEIAVSDQPDFLERMNIGYAVSQNYPNPFNPLTMITYTLPVRRAENGLRMPGKMNTSIRVYNVRGQLVRTLVDRPMDSGVYRVQWNGRDNRNIPVSSGIYFYRIKSEPFHAVKRMVLMK